MEHKVGCHVALVDLWRDKGRVAWPPTSRTVREKWGTRHRREIADSAAPKGEGQVVCCGTPEGVP